MMRSDELGLLKEGYLADVVLVDGNPLENLALLLDPAKINLVMKDGEVYKDQSAQLVSQAALQREQEHYPLQEEGIKEAMASADA